MVGLSYEQMKERQKLVDILCRRYDYNRWDERTRFLMFNMFSKKIANKFGQSPPAEYERFMDYVYTRFRKENPSGFRHIKPIDLLKEGRRQQRH